MALRPGEAAVEGGEDSELTKWKTLESCFK